MKQMDNYTEGLNAEEVEEKATGAARILVNELNLFNESDSGPEPVYDPAVLHDWFASGFAQLLAQKFVITPRA